MSPTTTSDPGVAMVTGATVGIGHEFARQLAERGHALVLVSRDVAKLGEVRAELEQTYGISVEVLAADLIDRDQLRAVEERLADADRPIDLLVNNAGFGLKHRFLDNDIETEQAHLDILVTAVLRLTHAALGPMAQRGRGGVINVSSVAAFVPRGTYSACKAWVNSFSQGAHDEYKSRGVSVMALCPGFTKTEFHQRMGVSRGSAPEFMWLDAQFLVRKALEDYDKGRTFSIPGAQYKTIIALTKAVPSSILQRFQSMGRK